MMMPNANTDTLKQTNCISGPSESSLPQNVRQWDQNDSSLQKGNGSSNNAQQLDTIGLVTKTRIETFSIQAALPLNAQNGFDSEIKTAF